MSLLAEVHADTLQRGGPRCSVALVRDLLTPADAAELDGLLADPAVAKAAVARALRNRGHRMSPESLTRHARGECLCPR